MRMKLIAMHKQDIDDAINNELSGRDLRLAKSLRWLIILINSIQIIINPKAWSFYLDNYQVFESEDFGKDNWRIE